MYVFIKKSHGDQVNKGVELQQNCLNVRTPSLQNSLRIIIQRISTKVALRFVTLWQQCREDCPYIKAQSVGRSRFFDINKTVNTPFHFILQKKWHFGLQMSKQLNFFPSVLELLNIPSDLDFHKDFKYINKSSVRIKLREIFMISWIFSLFLSDQKLSQSKN